MPEAQSRFKHPIFNLKFSFLLFGVLIVRELKSDPFEDYPFLNKTKNHLQYSNPKALKDFHSAWKNSRTKKFHVVHTGDSHVQNDVYPDQIRKNLQEKLGDGGQGMIFAYSAAGSYSPITYRTEHSNHWIRSKSFLPNQPLPMGITGMSCRTDEKDSELEFIFNQPIKNEYNRLKIFSSTGPGGFDIELIVDNSPSIHLDSKALSEREYLEIIIPPPQKKIRLVTREKLRENEYFEFYGMSLEKDGDTGLVWHNCGVGSARFNSILREEKFVYQLKIISPKLVILDFGTNDYLVSNRISKNLPSQIRKIIRMIKKNLPHSSILLTSTQDMNYKKKPRRVGPEFSGRIQKIASEMNCGFYDWFSVSGGMNSVENWKRYELMQTDSIHLTPRGYRLKADLFSLAIQKSMSQMDQKKSGIQF